MANPAVTVVIPTLQAGEDLRETLNSLAAQSFQHFEVIVVDNSKEGLAGAFKNESRMQFRVLAPGANTGFGGAANLAAARSDAPLIALLNDDAPPHPDWLSNLVEAAERQPTCGMFSCQIRLSGTDSLDSTSLEIAADGSSIQRAHGAPWASDTSPEEALLPSGCAALYRREALDAAGWFDEHFFLYCEDTDLGLRLRWHGWHCRYVSEAIVEHKYSRSAGVASPLKAYLVERNRLFLVLKNFPLPDLLRAVVAAPFRYVLHAVALAGGHGKASEFSRNQNGWLLPWMVLKAHLAVFSHLPRLLRQRAEIRRTAKIPVKAFREALSAHSVSLRRVAQH